MRLLFDSSVFVSALVIEHEHHVAALEWLTFAKSGLAELIVASHGILEVYAVLTRLPLKTRIGPNVAKRLIEESIVQIGRVVSLSNDDYISLIDELARRSIIGGAVYDAIHVKTAKQFSADYLITFNSKHFLRIWPESPDKILNPLTDKPG